MGVSPVLTDKEPEALMETDLICQGLIQTCPAGLWEVAGSVRMSLPGLLRAHVQSPEVTECLCFALSLTEKEFGLGAWTIHFLLKLGTPLFRACV